MKHGNAGGGPRIPGGLPRRHVLAGLLTAYTFSLIPWAAAQPVRDAGHGAFVAVSAILVGRPTLDAGLAKRLYDALVADDPAFPASAQSLLTLINDRKIDPLVLQQTLDTEQSPLAGLPRTIASAWFLGLVGVGDKARCIAFEDAMNAQMVSDVLKPPTYAYGAYGSWTRKPV